MNILTKICVVFLVVTSLVAAVVFINLATVPQNWRDKYNREEKAHSLLKAKSQGQDEINSQLSSDLNNLRKSLAEQKTKAQAQQAMLIADKGRLNLVIADLNRKLAASATTPRDAGKAATEYLYKQQQALKAAWDAESKAKLKMIELESQLLAEQAKNKRLEKALRVTQEKAQSQKDMITRLNDRLGELEVLKESKPGQTLSAPLPAIKLTGTISDVDDNLASVNIGSAQGLKTGMKLIVYRGDQFVGHLKIETVGASESAGVIVNRRLAPQRGDKVTSSLAN
ncbi:MAG: hypothetical protein DRP83_07100 [Planctomycetota bacterium]|nr:MAG: hypothetical protein DRP83_07100 [Planctomycetota bacterium]